MPRVKKVKRVSAAVPELSPSEAIADCKSEIHGAGLGLRRVFLEEFALSPPDQTCFIEVGPEAFFKNTATWIG